MFQEFQKHDSSPFKYLGSTCFVSFTPCLPRPPGSWPCPVTNPKSQWYWALVQIIYHISQYVHHKYNLVIYLIQFISYSNKSGLPQSPTCSRFQHVPTKAQRMNNGWWPMAPTRQPRAMRAKTSLESPSSSGAVMTHLVCYDDLFGWYWRPTVRADGICH